MNEMCYACTLPIDDGDSVVTLRDEHGQEWCVHQRCFTDEYFEAADTESASPEEERSDNDRGRI